MWSLVWCGVVWCGGGDLAESEIMQVHWGAAVHRVVRPAGQTQLIISVKSRQRSGDIRGEVTSDNHIISYHIDMGRLRLRYRNL